MNWAFHLIDNCDSQHYVTSDIHFQNHFHSDKIQILHSPLQKIIPDGKNEWNVPLAQLMNSKWGGRRQQQFILKMLDQKKVDMIHFHFAPMAAKYLKILKDWPGKKVVSFYGYDYEKAPFLNPNLNYKYQEIFKNADLILTEGRHGRSILIKMGCPGNKIKVLPLGIPQSNAPERPVKKAGELRLVQPASFLPKKGQINTVRAILRSGLKENISLTFVGEVGDKNYMSQLKEEAQPAVDAGLIRFQKFVSEGDFQSFLSKFHVVIQPSQYSENRDCEGGAPVTLLHAQWGGLPVISTMHCDIPHIVVAKETGALVGEGDIEALADKIKYFYNMDQSIFDVISNNAQVWARDHFNIRQSGSLLKEYYKELLL